MRWSGVTPRFRDFEFRARSTYGALDGADLIDWPLTLDEIQPYYDQAEAKMGISGTHGMPPSFETSNYKVLKAGGKRIGYREITSKRTAINSVARDGRPACRNNQQASQQGTGNRDQDCKDLQIDSQRAANAVVGKHGESAADHH